MATQLTRDTRQPSDRAPFNVRNTGKSPVTRKVIKVGEKERLDQAFRLLYGKTSRQRRPTDRIELHENIITGVPYSALFHLTEGLNSIPEELVAKMLTVSTRTLSRYRANPDQHMPPDLGDRTWRFAEIIAMAQDVIGSREDAETWLITPAMGLNGARPIDLLRTQQGATLVEEFLDRLKYGVYV